MKLSKRLNAVGEMVTDGNRIADIGTDHGFLPIELIMTGKCPSAIAMDVASGPLDRAKQHISDHDMNDKIICRLSDGFDKLEVDEVDTVIIAGMGGDLISNIINRKPKIAKEMVLSPHTHPEIVRRQLCEQEYEIVDENMIIDDGKYYVILKAIRSDHKHMLTKAEEYFGKVLLDNKNNVLHSYLLKEIEKFEDIPQKKEYLDLINSIIW